MSRLLDVLTGRSQRFGLSMDDDYAWTQLVSSYGTPDQERIQPTFLLFAGSAFGGNSIVFALISRRINFFSEAVFKYRALDDKHLFGDPSLARLEKPWPNGTTGELLARAEQDASLAGNFYLRDAGDRLERLRPDWVTIVSHITVDSEGRKVREVIGYLFEPVGDPDRGSELYLVDEVVHWSPMPDPLANFRGMSWLTPVVRDINADVSMTAHREAFFRNAATPNMIIKYQQRLNQDQRDRVRDAIAARHAGARNAFGTLVLDAGADLTVVGDRMQGSAFSELQAAGEIRLASAAGVPGIVAGLQQGRQTGAPGEYADAVRGFADLTIRPNWRSICAALEKFTKPPAGCQLWFDTTDISALQPGEKDSAGTMQVQAGTTNTLIMAGYEPDAVVQAVSAGDLTLLAGKHSGLTSVQMHKPGETVTDTPVAPGDQAGGGDQGDGGASTPSAQSGRHRRLESEESRVQRQPPVRAATRRRALVDNEFRDYWTENPKGLAQWADKPHPWTSLYRQILKHVPDPQKAKAITSAWFIRVFHQTASQHAAAVKGRAEWEEHLHPRDPHGEFAHVPGHKLLNDVEHTVHGGGHPVDPGRDKLKLAGKIQLDPGEHLVGSSKLSDEYGSVRLAATEKNGHRLLRIGVGNWAFGGREGGGPWTGGPDRFAEAQAATDAAAREREQLEIRYDELPPGPQRDAVQQRLDELDESGATTEVVPGGYTARLNEAQARQLRTTLADVAARLKAKDVEVQAAFDKIEALDAKPRDEWTPEEVAEYPHLRLVAHADSTEAIHHEEGVIPGEWGDLHYVGELDDVDPMVRLWVTPHGADPDDVHDNEETWALSPGDVTKLLRQIDSLTSA